MKFRLLGSLEVDAGNGAIDLGPRKQRAVLAVLLLYTNEIVPTDRIIDMVWGEDAPRTAEHSVHIYISQLRQALSNRSGGDLIETRPPGYVLNVPPDQVDILQFQRLVRDGLAAIRTGDVTRGQPKLAEALVIWRGAPLADFEYDEFAQRHIRSLKEIRADVLEALARIHLEQGHLDSARDLARDAIEADSFREEPREIMMLSLYQSGRQADALRHFSEYQVLLGEELGIEPSENLRQLEERLLLQDPTLDLQARIAAEGNPYLGLRAFSEEDADVYFGRESLVSEVLERLDGQLGYATIVGPSGSGKSSVARAGLVPILRQGGETIVMLQPGASPLWELAGALDRAGFGTRAGLQRRFESDGRALIELIDRPLVLLVDQFEELYTLAATDAAVRFSELLAAALRDESTPIRCLATLRADYYDRPLSSSALAGLFAASVVTVPPMTPSELERAIVGPARAAGVEVDSALLAQLVADMGDEPGALPLLQFTLFELFERANGTMSLATYERFGGLHGALSGGADEILDDLDEKGREFAEQLMMRMVRKGRALSTARPVALRDLVDMGVDRIVLQGVLEAFGSRRLITFDRDATGAAVIEMAHEQLISEWPQLTDWIDEHSEDLDRLQALRAAASEWLEVGQSDDYLLRGDRLVGFLDWGETSSMSLTRAETHFMDASVELRTREGTESAARAKTQETLARSARRRLWALGAAVAALAAAVTFLIIALTPPAPPDVVVWSGGRDGGASDEFFFTGFDAAAADFGLEIVEFTVDDSQVEQIEDQIVAGTGLVFIQAVFLAPHEYEGLIGRHPETSFVLIDFCPDLGAPNLFCLDALDIEVAYLAGAAAGLASESGRVGFIGGVDMGLIHVFETGYEQGVGWVDSSVVVESIYLTSSTDTSGFTSPGLGEIGANYLLDSGSDVLFHAAGPSSLGVYKELERWSAETGLHAWGIGPDLDDARRLETLAGADLEAQDVPLLQQHILTSVVKRFDLGIYQIIEHYIGSGEATDMTLTIANGGVDYVTTGAHIEPWVLQMEEAKEAIASGSVVLEARDIGPRLLVGDLVGS